MTQEQIQMLIKIVKGSPLYEEHIKEELLNVLRDKLNG